MPVNTMYTSNSSDDEELLDSCASKCFLLLQETFLQQYQEHPVSVDRNAFGQYHHLYKKLGNYPSQPFIIF
jgi:hypothetical protein